MDKLITLRYDGVKLKFTKEYISTIKDLMRAEILMMRKNHPDTKAAWVCGVAKIEDLSSSNSISMIYGSKTDRYGLKKEGDIFIEVPLNEEGWECKLKW